MNVRCLGTVLLATVTVSAAAMAPGAEDRYQAQADRARELLCLLVSEKYEEFVEASECFLVERLAGFLVELSEAELDERFPY